MNEQCELNFSRAEQGRNIGMLLSESKANETIEGWSVTAFIILQDFLRYYQKDTFLAERIREWCYKNGLRRPPNERAWGGVISRASKAGLIVFAGYDKTKNLKAHRTPAALWKKGKALK